MPELENREQNAGGVEFAPCIQGTPQTQTTCQAKEDQNREMTYVKLHSGPQKRSKKEEKASEKRAINEKNENAQEK